MGTSNEKSAGGILIPKAQRFHTKYYSVSHFFQVNTKDIFKQNRTLLTLQLLFYPPGKRNEKQI